MILYKNKINERERLRSNERINKIKEKISNKLLSFFLLLLGINDLEISADN